MKNTTMLLIISLLLTYIGCGGGENNNAKPPVTTLELTPFQEQNGIGPITEKITLGAIDKKKAEAGGKIFETKCFSCHRLDQRLVGPPLREVTKRRTPEFILNMILNPAEMQQKHPVVKQLLAEYLTAMTFQNVSKDEAMLILEYLRAEAENKPQTATK